MTALSTTRRVVFGTLATAGVLALAAGPAAAMSVTEHDSFPAAGSVFACGDTTITAQTGTVSEVFHENSDAAGMFHFTGTITVHGVTLTDEAGNEYTLSGATWFGGKGSDPEGNLPPVVSTETDHFVLHDASGGVYAKVQMVGHVSPNGKSFFFDRGTCTPPTD